MPEQYDDRLIGGTRLVQSRLRVQLPSRAKRFLTGILLYRDTALLRPHYWGGPTSTAWITRVRKNKTHTHVICADMRLVLGVGVILFRDFRDRYD